MTAVGNNVHIFAQPHRREALQWLFETVLGCQVATVAHPGMMGPMLLIRFADGGNITIEFVENAADADQPRLAAWLELRTGDPAALMQTVIDSGVQEVKHPGHPHYFMAPGGQVFTIVPATR